MSVTIAGEEWCGARGTVTVERQMHEAVCCGDPGHHGGHKWWPAWRVRLASDQVSEAKG